MSGVKGTHWGHVKPCPSWSAYKHHIRSREVPCEPCRQFVNAERGARREDAAYAKSYEAYRASVVAWRAEHEESLRRQAVWPLVALLAEAVADERRRSRAA